MLNNVLKKTSILRSFVRGRSKKSSLEKNKYRYPQRLMSFIYIKRYNI